MGRLKNNDNARRRSIGMVLLISCLCLYPLVYKLDLAPSMVLVKDAERRIVVNYDMNVTQELETLLLLHSGSNNNNAAVDLSSYDTWLASVYGTMVQNNKTELYYSLSDSKYSARFEELLHKSSACFPRAQLVMAAFDVETYDWFTNRSVPTLYLKTGTIKERIMNAKYNGFLALLVMMRRYFRDITTTRAYASEMDIYWKSTPQLNISADFLVSQHKNALDGEVNIGFYAAKPTLDVIHLFYRLAKWMDLPDSYRPNPPKFRCGTFDQKVMDLAIRGAARNNAFVAKRNGNPECYFPPHQLQMLVPPTPLQWDYVPFATLEHPPIDNPNRSDLNGVHVWSGMGTPAQQIEWAFANFVSNDTNR